MHPGGGGVRMLRVPNFVKNYTIGCAIFVTAEGYSA